MTTPIPFNPALRRTRLVHGPMMLALAATLGISACHRPDGQMSDSAAADAPKESASLGAAIDDTAITAKVKQRLASDQRTQDAKISVETNNGVVTLSGQAPDAASKSAAEDLARHVAAVQGIDNRISAPSALDDMASRAGAAAEKVGDSVSDAAITTAVKTRFATDSQINASAIHVDTDQGVVKLRGEVASAELRRRVLELTRKVDGVRDIDDGDLKVVRS